jgi:hypothetical protein
LQQNNVDQLSFLKKNLVSFTIEMWTKLYLKIKLQSFMVHIVGEIMYINVDKWKLIDFA